MATTTRTQLKPLLASLVAMPTFTLETATCRAALDWIKDELRNLPLHIHEISHNGHDALVFTTRRTKRPKVMLHTHIDVSPAPPEQLKLTERDGKYFGRGVFDMKFAAAGFIKLLLDLGDELSRYDLGVTFTTDEETTGGDDGAAQLAARGFGGEVILNPDAVGGWNIERAAKGQLRYRITSHGLPGHASRPWAYRNAINQLMAFLDELATHFPSEPCGDANHEHQTLNIGIFRGGKIANQVAAEAEAVIDIRMTPGQTVDEMEALVLEVGSAYEHLSFEHFSHDAPIQIDTDGPHVQRLARLIQEVAGSQPAFILSHGASESGHYITKGMPVIMFGPDGGGHHSADEWVDVQGVEDFYTVVRRFVEESALLTKH